MAELINLRQARKKRERLARETRAEQNRAKHGVSKKERSTQEAEAARMRREFDGKKITPAGDSNAPSGDRTAD